MVVIYHFFFGQTRVENSLILLKLHFRFKFKNNNIIMSDIVETSANGAENATVTPAKSIIITKSIKSLTQ